MNIMTMYIMSTNIMIADQGPEVKQIVEFVLYISNSLISNFQFNSLKCVPR